MEWWAVLLFFVGGLIFLLLSGFPIAFSFLLMDLIGILIFMGPLGLKHVTLNIFTSISTFVIAPVPLFILMGELMFHSNIAYNTIDVLDRWLGRVPGRLSLLAATSGTIFAATSGSTMANTAMLGTVLLPEMRNRGYSTSMSVGPIVGVGGLAMLIPPSALAVVLASIGKISVGRILMAGVIPGLILGCFFGAYIVITAWLKPSIAPPYQVQPTPLGQKILLTIKYLIPVAFIIFMVIGLIILGFATPTEAAASGVIATLLVTLVYGRFSWKMLKDTLTGSVHISVMVFMIIAASKTFSSILAFTGASTGLTDLVKGLEVHPILILIFMQLIIAFMGTFMEAISIMMICLPVFMPISHVLGFDPVWFGVLMLINLEMGQITPPFGMLLFVMKGVAPEDVSIEEICWAALPYIVFDILIMATIIVWPDIALWLPGMLGE
ncbi:MAG: TRAP transporter large permease subunit [Deltaproteobacteria bacterium]|nr:TRAP transporter large permease subunit [Deltaproteobacteria bacterium]MBW2137180.1 TRAP transporter large permease subunit [Deltaproteobacteria bacterium]